MRASASVNAMPRNMVVRATPAASGWRAIAVMAFPAPFGLFTPQNRIVAYFPWVWLPTFLVQLALAGHLLMFRKLQAMPPEKVAD